MTNSKLRLRKFCIAVKVILDVLFFYLQNSLTLLISQQNIYYLRPNPLYLLNFLISSFVLRKCKMQEY